MPGRKQLSKAGRAHSTFSLLVMSFSMHTHTNVPFFFQRESQYKEPVKPSPCLFSVAPLKCKGHLLCRCPGRCLNVQVCAQAKPRVQAQRFKYQDLSAWTWHCHFKTRDVHIKVFHSPEGKDYFTPFQTMSLISLPFLQPSLSLSLSLSHTHFF